MTNNLFSNENVLNKRIFFLKKAYPYLITAIFLSLSILLIYHHEYWGDEVHSWFLGSESNSISELFSIIRVAEYSSSLWYIILHFISHYISDNIEIMKAIHLLVSTATAFLFLKYSPFNIAIKTLFVFGYFVFYEFSIISRNYALGILFIVIFLVLYKNRFKNLIPIGIVLFLMGQVNFLSFVISISFFLLFLIELINYSKKNSLNKIYFTIFILLVLSEIIFFSWQLIPQISRMNADFSVVKTSNLFLTLFSDRLVITKFSENTIKAFAPIPPINLEFWNNNLIVDYLRLKPLKFRVITSFILLVFPIFILKRKAALLYTFMGILFSITFVFYKNDSRQLGHLFILLIACFLISEISKYDDFLIRNKKIIIEKILNAFLILILTISVFGSSVAFYYDYKYPFSSGKRVADYIDNNFDREDIIIIGMSTASRTVAGYLSDEIYFIQTGKFEKLVKWDEIKGVSKKEISNKISYFLNENKTVLLIVNGNEKLDLDESSKKYFQRLIRFENSIINNRNFYLYIFENA